MAVNVEQLFHKWKMWLETMMLWLHRKMLRITWTDHVMNEEDLRWIRAANKLFLTIRKREINEERRLGELLKSREAGNHISWQANRGTNTAKRVNKEEIFGRPWSIVF